MLKLKNIIKKFGTTVVLDNVSYNFEENNIYGIVGINGIGKTTLLNTISRYDNVNTGNIFVDDKDISRSDYLDTPISYAMDNPIFFNELTLKENMLLVCASKKYNKLETMELINYMINEFKLQKYKDYFPLDLSKGTIQRLNVACALLRKEKICLLDEPFSGLDPLQVQILERVVREFHDKYGGIYIISSHDIESLRNICHKCILLNEKSLTDISMEQITREKISRILGATNEAD